MDIVGMIIFAVFGLLMLAAIIIPNVQRRRSAPQQQEIPD